MPPDYNYRFTMIRKKKGKKTALLQQQTSVEEKVQLSSITIQVGKVNLKIPAY